MRGWRTAMNGAGKAGCAKENKWEKEACVN